MTWRISRVQVATSSNTWRISRVMAVSGSPSAVQLAPFADRSVLSMELVTVTAALADGSPAADSYAFTLIPNGAVHTLPMSGSGASRTFRSPGRMGGCDVQIRVDAISAGVVVDSEVATLHVGAHTDFIRRNGQWVAITRPRRLTVA